MPTYNYKCNNCKVEFSIFQSINEDNLNNCPDCNVEDSIRRIITGGTGMIFKGDGFYVTDYTNYGKKKDNKKNNKKQDDDKGKKNK